MPLYFNKMRYKLKFISLKINKLRLEDVTYEAKL
jgi:hypothetical protein